jgi:hypothetical protein
MTTPSPRTHDTSGSGYHLKDITEFAAKLNQVGAVILNRNPSGDTPTAISHVKNPLNYGLPLTRTRLARSISKPQLFSSPLPGCSSGFDTVG